VVVFTLLVAECIKQQIAYHYHFTRTGQVSTIVPYRGFLSKVPAHFRNVLPGLGHWRLFQQLSLSWYFLALCLPDSYFFLLLYISLYISGAYLILPGLSILSGFVPLSTSL